MAQLQALLHEQTDTELKSLRVTVNRGTPYDSNDRVAKMATSLGLGHTLRPRGRSRKQA